MEPWKQWILKEPTYYSDASDLPVSLDLRDTQDKTFKFLRQMEAVKIEELQRTRSKQKQFPKEYLMITGAKLESINANRKSSFHPKRFYWSNKIEYLVYLSCLSFNPVTLDLASFDRSNPCSGMREHMTKFYLNIFFLWVVKYLLLSLGIYHKQGIFQMKAMVPIARYFPYFLTAFVVVSVSLSARRVAEEVISLLWDLKELYLFGSTGLISCKNSNPFPGILTCFEPRDMIPTEKDNCTIDSIDSLSFNCANGTTKYIFAANIPYFYVNNDPVFQFYYEVAVVSTIFVSLVALHFFQPYLKMAIAINISLLVMILLSINVALNEYSISKLIHLPLECFLFLPSEKLLRDSLVFSIKDFSLTVILIWAATARLQRSSSPGYDTLFLLLISAICNGIFYSFGLISYIVIYSYIGLDAKIVLRLDTTSTSVAMLWTFIEAIDLSPRGFLPIFIILLVLSINNILIISMEAINFNLTFINETTLIYRNVAVIIQAIVIFAVGKYLSRLILFCGVSQMRWVFVAFDLYAIIIFFLIVRVYTINRLSVDVDFMTGSRPNWLVSVLFIGPPIMSIMVVIYCFFKEDCSMWLNIPCSLLLFITLIYLLYEFFKYGTTIALRLTPTFSYGPPNNILRRERKLFTESVPKFA